MAQWGRDAEAGIITWDQTSEGFTNEAAGQGHVLSTDPFTNFGNTWYKTELPPWRTTLMSDITTLSIGAAPWLR
jgi:hypothetical protein